MNVASLELCKELYEVSGWKNTEYFYSSENKVHRTQIEDDDFYGEIWPAYDLGYLLRKLPQPTYIYGLGDAYSYPQWIAKATHQNIVGEQKAETPEDATAKLAIELFKQGVLTK